MAENDSTDSARARNPGIFDPRLAYSTSELMKIFGKNRAKFAKWKAAGLRPLATESNEEWFWGEDLLAIWRQGHRPRE